jgi:hypothetical protein
LSIIASYTPEINKFKLAHNIEDAEFEQWRTEELEYLQNIRTESLSDAMAMEYVEALQNLEKLK